MVSRIDIPKDLDGIIAMYEAVVKPMAKDAKGKEVQSYGGYLRNRKGDLVEYIAESLITIAWAELGGEEKDLKFSTKKLPIPMKRGYHKRVNDNIVSNYIHSNIKKYLYHLKVDKHVYIKDKFVLGVECKAYAENAMIKRICVDFWFFTKHRPTLSPKPSCVLLQLESMLRGDYSESPAGKYGSEPTHSILSHFPIDIEIITLLEVERDIKKPIHEEKFYKPLKREALEYTLERFKEKLKPFVSSK